MFRYLFWDYYFVFSARLPDLGQLIEDDRPVTVLRTVEVEIVNFIGKWCGSERKNDNLNPKKHNEMVAKWE
jgi:hypothetical protein